MIERNQYLSKLISAKNNGFPKIITGIRRCGKSYLLKEIFKKHLIETGVSENQIIIIDLDELKNAKYRNPIELDKYIREHCNKDTMNYVFIDELQLVSSIINPIYTEGKYVIANENNKYFLNLCGHYSLAGDVKDASFWDDPNHKEMLISLKKPLKSSSL